MTQATIQRETHTIDATGKSLGRLASDIAVLLCGKQKPSWQPRIDGGDFVEVVNVDKVVVTGNKEQQKVYYRHSQYPGGLKEQTYAERVEKSGHQGVLEDAVNNMLPKNRTRQHLMKRLTFKNQA